jgi:hypothetical protein
MTPHEFVFGDAPDIGNLRVWGSKTFVKRPRDTNRKDFSETTKTGFLLGYSDTPKGYKVFIPDTNSIMYSVHCAFNEEIPERGEEYFEEMRKLYIQQDCQNILMTRITWNTWSPELVQSGRILLHGELYG